LSNIYVKEVRKHVLN